MASMPSIIALYLFDNRFVAVARGVQGSLIMKHYCTVHTYTTNTLTNFKFPNRRFETSITCFLRSFERVDVLWRTFKKIAKKN